MFGEVVFVGGPLYLVSAGFNSLFLSFQMLSFQGLKGVVI